MNYKWNWGILFEVSPEGKGTYLEMLLSGLMWTLTTAFFAWMIAQPGPFLCSSIL